MNYIKVLGIVFCWSIAQFTINQNWDILFFMMVYINILQNRIFVKRTTGLQNHQDTYTVAKLKFIKLISIHLIFT